MKYIYIECFINVTQYSDKKLNHRPLSVKDRLHVACVFLPILTVVKSTVCNTHMSNRSKVFYALTPSKGQCNSGGQGLILIPFHMFIAKPMGYGARTASIDE